MAPYNMRAMLLAFLILWSSVFNFSGACAHSIQPLDQPITAVSSGEFGLPQELSVHLHSHTHAQGPEAKAIVLGARDADSEGLTVDDRSLWDFVWAATKVFVNPMSWTSGVQFGSLVCKGLGWWTSAPSWVQWTCNTFGIVSTMVSVWDGRADLATAYNDWRNQGASQGNLDTLVELPFYRDYGDASVGERGLHAKRGHGNETGYYDWTVLHPYLANRTITNALLGNSSILHDVSRNYSIITMAHILNSSQSNPISVQRSLNGTLLGSPISMFFVNGTGSSAGFAAHHSFDGAVASGKRDNCGGFADESGDLYADNTALCGAGGTETVDGISDIYYGLDMYGTESQWKEYDADVGGQYPDSNGLWGFANDLSNSAQDEQWWRACLCDQESGDYAWTGALQYTWNGGFNGWNDCYSGTCGGATA